MRARAVRRAGMIPRLPRVADHVSPSQTHRVVVATYLLAPGYFADLAAASGADVVTPPLLLPHEPPANELVDIVVERYLS